MQIAEKSHSLLGASGMGRWSKCPGSVALHRALLADDAAHAASPDLRSSEFALAGTVAHEIAERCLRENTDAWEYMGETFEVRGEKVAADHEMTAATQVFVDAVRECHGPEDRLDVELDVGLPGWDADIRGTADAVIWSPKTGRLIVMDLKFGEGVAVDACGNNQLRYYAACAANTLHRLGVDTSNFETVEMSIVQPRIDREGGPVSTEVLTAEELGAWVNEVLLPAVSATRKPEAPLVTGEHCQFCPAAASCPEMAASVAEMTKGLPADPKEAETESRLLSDEELARRAELIAVVRMHVKALEKEVFVRLRQGREVPGFKLVPKRTNRIWTDGAEQVIIERFGDNAWNPPALKSPAQIERLGDEGKETVAELAYKPEGGLTFAPVYDSRKEVELPSPADVFKNID